jgi:hypothetical protein
MLCAGNGDWITVTPADTPRPTLTAEEMLTDVT